MTPAGFPHSDIHGSRFAFNSPWLFVDRYVLLRLPMPRHPPCALLSLTSLSFRQLVVLQSCSNHFWVLTICKIIVITLILHHFTLISFRSLFSSQGTGHSRKELVGSNGLEPSTSRLSGVRSNHLSYEPMCVRSALSPFLVEMNRIELSTPCLQGRCSPS